MTQLLPPYPQVFHRLSVSFSFVFLNGWPFVMPPLVWIPDSVPLSRSGYKYFWLVQNLLNQSEEVYPNLSSDASSVWNFCACSPVIFFSAKPVFVLHNVGCFLRLACFLLDKNRFNSSYFGMILIDNLMMLFQKLQIESSFFFNFLRELWKTDKCLIHLVHKEDSHLNFSLAKEKS